MERAPNFLSRIPKSKVIAKRFPTAGEATHGPSHARHDLPQKFSARVNPGKSVSRRENGREEAVFRRTDIGFLKQAEAGGRSRSCVGRMTSSCNASFYIWRSKYGRMDVPDAKRLKELEAENARLSFGEKRQSAGCGRTATTGRRWRTSEAPSNPPPR